MTTMTLSENKTLSYPKLSLALIAAAINTLALLFIMHRLIFIEDVALDTTPDKPIPTIIMEKPVIKVEKIQPPAKPLEPTVEPPKPQLLTNDSGSEGLHVTNPPDFKSGITTKNNIKIGLGPSSLVKAVAVAPKYPGRALSKGIEGFVDVMFDVTSYGATKNIQVITAQPTGVFEKSAIRAVTRWRYKPRIIDGHPQSSFGVKERIRFTIEK